MRVKAIPYRRKSQRLSSQTRSTPRYVIERRDYFRTGAIEKAAFAREAIKKQVVVFEIPKRSVRLLTKTEVEAYLDDVNNPHDSVIHIEGGNTLQSIVGAHDSNTSERDWYAINHSATPNMKMRFRNGTVQWVTTKEVAENDQLCFEYTDPDERWRSDIILRKYTS